MNISKTFFKSLDGKIVPAFKLEGGGEGAFLLVHGYSSSKVEMVGIAYELAEAGYDCFCIDLRGHGENESELDEKVIMDVEGVLESLREDYEKVYAVGHSLGGLLALKSSADFVYAISPPIMKKVADVVKFMLILNSCKVREAKEGVLFEILEKYNPPERRRDAIVFYGSGESEPFKVALKEWARDRDVELVEIDEMQAEMPALEVDPVALKNYLPRFVSHQTVVKSKKLVEKIRS